MKKGLTELVFILDRSGSMSELEADTIGGFNGMLEKQKVDNIFLYDDRTGAVDRIYDLDDIRTEEDIMRFREKLAEMLVGEYPMLEERRWKRNDRNAYRKN